MNNDEKELDLSWIFQFIILSFQLLQSFKNELSNMLCSIPWIPILGQKELMSKKQLTKVILLNPSSIYNKYRSSLLPNLQFIDVDKIPSELFNCMKKEIFIDLDINYCESFSDFISLCVIPSYEEILRNSIFANSSIPIDLSDNVELYKLIKHYFDFFKSSEFLSNWASLIEDSNKHLLQKLQNTILIPISNSKYNIAHLKNVHVHYQFENDKNGCPNLDGWYFLNVSKNNKQFLLFLRQIGCTFGPKIVRSKESDELNQLFEIQSKNSTSKAIKNQITNYIVQSFFENSLCIDLNYENLIGNTSKFGPILKLLRKSEWIYCDTHDTCHCPNKFFWYSPATVNFFGKNVCVTGKAWNKNTIQKLGIREKIDCEDAIRYIHQLSDKYKNDQEEREIIKIHESEYSQLLKVYNFLMNEMPRNTSNNKFKHVINDKKWIFIPESKVKFDQMKAQNEFYYGSFWYSDLCFFDDHNKNSNLLEQWGYINMAYYYDFHKFRNIGSFNHPNLSTYATAFKNVYKKLKPTELVEQVWIFFEEFFGEIKPYTRESFLREINAPMIPVYGNDESTIIWKSLNDIDKFYYIDSLDTFDYLETSLSLKQPIQIIRPPFAFKESSYNSSQRSFLVKIVQAIPLSSVINSSIQINETDRELDLSLYKIFDETYLETIELFIRYTLKIRVDSIGKSLHMPLMPEVIAFQEYQKKKEEAKKFEKEHLDKYFSFFSNISFYKCKNSITKIITILGERFETEVDVAIDGDHNAIYRKQTLNKDAILNNLTNELARYFSPAFFIILHKNEFVKILSSESLYRAKSDFTKFFVCFYFFFYRFCFFLFTLFNIRARIFQILFGNYQVYILIIKIAKKLFIEIQIMCKVYLVCMVMR